MNRIATSLLLTLPLWANAQDVTIKGQIVWDSARGPAPKRVPLKATKDQELAAKDKDFNSEEYIVDAVSGGIKNVAVWLAPEPSAADLKAFKANRIKDFPSFKPGDIHPKLAKVEKKTHEIDQPCCRFIPHVVLV